jgi:hypothetical protein
MTQIEHDEVMRSAHSTGALIDMPPVEVTDEGALIREAQRRQRRLRFATLGVVAVILASGAIAATAISAGRSGPPLRPPSTERPAHAAKPLGTPAEKAVSAGPFAGTWHVQTTSLTIGADGTGTATWPGPVSPGKSQATAVPNHAQLRLTAVQGTRAIGMISNSTDQAELPDGPVRLRVTSQDVLHVVTAQAVTVAPDHWKDLCGVSAAALTLDQQIAAGINCGA